MVDHVPHNEDGVGGMHVYMPWWLDNKKLDFPRGYHIEVWRRARAARRTDSWAAFSATRAAAATASSSRRTIARYYGATIGFNGRGEMIPNDDCYCEIDPNVVDQFGIPVLRFHWKWTTTSTTR